MTWLKPKEETEETVVRTTVPGGAVEVVIMAREELTMELNKHTKRDDDGAQDAGRRRTLVEFEEEKKLHLGRQSDHPNQLLLNPTDA
ncbi:hypothetical protein L1887_33212 [Cichorium endivia]|nr:hypothetical protein L1887_33212 [Cichorium endivia]